MDRLGSSLGGRGSNDSISVDCHRKYITIVIIGVLTDDVYATGGRGDPLWRTTVLAAEQLRNVLTKISQRHKCASSGRGKFVHGCLMIALPGPQNRRWKAGMVH